jgi:hypothetical protein
MQDALSAYVTATFTGIGSLFLIGLVVVAGLALAYGATRR